MRDEAQSIVCVYNGIISYLSVDFSFIQDAAGLNTGGSGWLRDFLLRSTEADRKDAHCTLASNTLTSIIF